MISKKEYHKVLSAFMSPKEGVYLPSVLLKFFKCHRVAAVFQQLNFWSDKGARADGFVYKSAVELAEETWLTKPQIDRIFKKLAQYDFFEVINKKANGAPTRHYRICMDKFVQALSPLVLTKSLNGNNDIVKSDLTISLNGNNDIVKSITDNNYIQLHRPSNNTHSANEDSEKLTPPDAGEVVAEFKRLKHPDPLRAGLRFHDTAEIEGWEHKGRQAHNWHTGAAYWARTDIAKLNRA